MTLKKAWEETWLPIPIVLGAILAMPWLFNHWYAILQILASLVVIGIIAGGLKR